MTLVPANEQAAILRALNLDPRDAKVQALALVAQRYNLDLILGHVYLVKGNVFVSHAGLLHLAHLSGDLDGIEVELVEDDKKFVATAKVYRKSMSRPFTYTDQCLKTEQVMSPRKRAITRAERNALRRAFDVGVDVYEDDRPEPAVVLSDSRPEVPRQGISSFPPGGQGEGPKAVPRVAASRESSPPSAPPEPSLESVPMGDARPESQSTLDAGRSVVIRCREMGLSDDLRHSLVRSATEGRTESTKELTAKEASLCHQMLHDLQKTGDATWHTSQSRKSERPNPPSSENPAPTSTSSSESPAGGDADDAKPSAG